MKRHLLSAADLTLEDATLVLDTAEELEKVSERTIKKLPTLRGRTVVNLFFEDSTRTKTSFELAAKRLSADVINFSAKGSSVSKGESLKDTALTLQAMGADAVVNAKTCDAAAEVKKLTGGGAHGVLITAPSLEAFKQGVGMTRKRGTCVLTGLPPGEFPFPLFDVVLNCITVRGSLVGTRQDMAEALAFAAEGKVKADIELQPLSAINNVFDRLARGDVAARVVLEFPSA